MNRFRCKIKAHFKGFSDWLMWACFIVMVFTSISAHMAQSNGWKGWIISGPTYLEISKPKISLVLKKEFQSLELKFDRAVVITNAKVVYPEGQYRISQDANVLKLERLGSIEQKTIKLELSERDREIYLAHIEKVFINGKKIHLFEFITDYVGVFEEEISYQYLFAPKNIGQLVAKAGQIIPLVIVVAMLPFLLLQLFIFVGAIPDKFEMLPALKISIENVELADTFVDKLAMPLGLLGTISALWSSFEFMSIDFGGLPDILNLVAEGMFTTFLALVLIALKEIRLTYLER